MALLRDIFMGDRRQRPSETEGTRECTYWSGAKTVGEVSSVSLTPIDLSETEKERESGEVAGGGQRKGGRQRKGSVSFKPTRGFLYTDVGIALSLVTPILCTSTRCTYACVPNN